MGRVPLGNLFMLVVCVIKVTIIYDSLILQFGSFIFIYIYWFMQDSFAIKQSLTFPEFFRVTLVYYFGSRRFKRFIIFYTVAVSAFIFLEVFSFGNGRFSGWEVLEYLVPVILLTLVGILAVFIYSLITYRLTRPRLTDIRIEITRWGFTCRDWQPEVSKPWRQIATFKETASFFILYPDPMGFYIIRKAALKSGE